MADRRTIATRPSRDTIVNPEALASRITVVSRDTIVTHDGLGTWDPYAGRDGYVSATATIFEDRSETNTINEQFELQFYPGPEQKAQDDHLVEFDPDDPLNPKNWSRSYRWLLTVLSGVIVLNASFASSAPSGIIPQLVEEFGMSSEVSALTIALFVAGYCIGPIVWGPLSEQIGRRPVFIISFTVYTGFQIGNALSKNIASILIFRLLGGTFAAAPMTNSGALISDIWDAGTRGKAMALFALAPFAGPALGPIVSGYINNAHVSWRWLFWVLTMFAGVCLVGIILLIPETFAPIIMVTKAKELRKQTGDEKYYAPMEKMPKRGVLKYLEETIARPFKILFQEPMLIAITVYMSFVYGCLYLLFEAYPIVFEGLHHFSTGTGGLMFLPVFGGGAAGVFAYLFYFNPRYERLIEHYKPRSVPPEARLEVAIVASPIFAIGFFWFAWTSFPSISFWAPMMSGLLIGATVVLVFLALLNYIVDAYLFVAASALAANTVARSSFGAAFPLFGQQMYDALNPRWASTLIGCIALIMIPIPLVLRRYGPTLRKRSKHAPTPAAPAKPEKDKLDKLAESEV
ncbi:MFS general substrate transporter [Fomitiporia mediterranea MF3/22]|uniref:MFS general substrate transporter n=1 Tax=Fomitiporia mediterranea (strain MF3/22) TaxID=694068 RepID=UPI0004408E51|nr:MFS general substrate transporter [Fomitiporia mediterranea MF3/22]EJD04797.1 MFS general substrate transporter [Fomitiporia mediterranea MF3/22]